MQDANLLNVLQIKHTELVMAKKRSRGRAGGRPPQGEFSNLTSPLTIRMPEDMRTQLEAAASKSGKSVTQELLRRLRDLFQRDIDEDRDPALRALNFFIAEIAEQISGGMYLRDQGLRSAMQKEWRADLFNFKAFKFAVSKLLDALEEPPGKVRVLSGSAKKKFIAKFGPTALERIKSPEAFGSYQFNQIWELSAWAQKVRDTSLGEEGKELMLKFPQIWKALTRQLYGLPEARRDLELKPNNALLDEFSRRAEEEKKP